MHPLQKAGPPRPEAYFYLFGWFLEMGRARPVSQVGALPMPWSEMDAWCRLRGIKLKAWEIRVLGALDDLWLDIQGRKTVTMEDLTGEPAAE